MRMVYSSNTIQNPNVIFHRLFTFFSHGVYSVREPTRVVCWDKIAWGIMSLGCLLLRCQRGTTNAPLSMWSQHSTFAVLALSGPLVTICCLGAVARTAATAVLALSS
jgi:hypothetical protein